MPHEPTLAELREKKKKNDAYITKISQRTHALGDTIRAQEKNLKMFDRKERTHRLCTRGGMLESFLHDPNALTNNQVMELLRVCLRQNPVQDALNKMLEKQQIPTVHLGRAVSAMEARGEKTFLGDLNRDIKETNKLLANLRKGFRHLQEWVTRKIEESKARREERRIEKHPPLYDYLYSWVLIQNEKRQHWKNRTVVLKRMASDMLHVSEAIDFLKAQKIFTVEDMKAKLDVLESEARSIDAELKKVSKRLKNICGITEAANTMRQLHSIHEQYNRIYFKGKKQAFYEQHREELMKYGKAYSYLMKVNGSAQVDAAVLKEESDRLIAHRANLQQRAENMKPLLTQLRNVKRCVDIAIQDEEPEYPSIMEKLEKDSQEQLTQRQREEEQKQSRNQKKPHL